jgi:hypothetical protein
MDMNERYDLLEGIRFVADNSTHVRIDMHRLEEAVLKFNYDTTKSWRDVAPFNIPKLEDSQRIAFVMILDSLNFCYWGTPKWTIRYQDKDIDGAFGLIGCMYRALEEKVPILDPNFLESMNSDDLRQIFRGNTEIPLFHDRLKILNEVGRNINRKYDGNFTKPIEDADKDVFLLLQNIVDTFPSYDDTSVYKGKEVKFYKRAQLAIMDIYEDFGGKGPGEFRNIDQLVAFAEYKIPQILRKLAILEYDSYLSEKVDNKILLPKDSTEEIEIRANMVWAVELMKERLKSRYPDITSASIDSHLWINSQEKSPTDKPYHLTRTTAY